MDTWYPVLSMGFGYIAALIIVGIVLLSFRQFVSDRAIWRRVKKNHLETDRACAFRILSPGGKRIMAGEDIDVPYEGTMGAGHSCDVCIPFRKVHLRSAFFWMEPDGLHIVPLHRDGILVDDVRVEPGDEAVMTEGAILQIGTLRMAMLNPESRTLTRRGPYVTKERRILAKKGKGEGIGRAGKRKDQPGRKKKHEKG